MVATVAGVAAAGYWQSATIATQRRELATLREQTKEVERLREENKEIPKLRVQLRATDSLKQETAEIHQLRNEVRQLRDDKAALAKAQTENQQLRGALQQVQQAAGEQLRAQQQQFAQYQAANLGQKSRNDCIANLKQIDGAVQQWALENRKRAADPYSLADRNLLAYLRGSTLPVCPAGGVYVGAATVAGAPRCTMPGHTL